MDAKIMNRTSGPKFGARMALLASAAVLSVTFTASTTVAAPRADVSYSKAQKALNKGKTDKAIGYAEAAVLAEPRNASYRALLGEAYLKAGRYTSAAMSFGDALELGDRNPRTVLSYALTQTAIGGGKNALDKLMTFERALDPADLGLAMALAGNPERGVFVLTNTLRAGANTPKVRQNLAYTYALAGNWRAARVMAAEDVPADQLDARLSDWASKAKPEDHMVRVADLLGIAPVRDGGLPTALALSNFPSGPEMIAEAKAKAAKDKAPVQVAQATKQAAPSPASSAKAMSAVGSQATAKTVDTIMAAMTAPEPVKVAAKGAPKPKPTPRKSSKTVKPTGPIFVSRPVTQKLPASSAPTRVAAVATPVPPKAPKSVAKAPSDGSHMVQLGSYSTQAEAKAGWATLQRKYGQLAAHDVVITKAEVKGKIYYRVAAAGFGRKSAAQMCSAVKSSGGGCFAYATKYPPKGAVGEGVRIAAATP